MSNDHRLIGWRFVVGNNCFEHLKGAINGVCMFTNNDAGLAILQLQCVSCLNKLVLFLPKIICRGGDSSRIWRDGVNIRKGRHTKVSKHLNVLALPGRVLLDAPIKVREKFHIVFVHCCNLLVKVRTTRFGQSKHGVSLKEINGKLGS